MKNKSRAPSRSSRINGVLVIECIDKTDPGSEGRFLSHMFNLMEVQTQYVEARTKAQFMAMLMANPFNTLHITTHGYVPRFGGFWVPDNDAVELDDFPQDCLQGQIVVSTACCSGSASFAKSFRRRVAARYYIAPKGKPKFHNAIFFAHLFYHNVAVLGQSPPDAMERYEAGYKNPHDFLLVKG